MAYRISLHLLSAIWNCLLLAWAISLRKNSRQYSSLVPVCFFASIFSMAWAIGLVFESLLAIRLTWLGAFWPGAMLIFIRDTFGQPVSDAKRFGLWGTGGIIALSGLTPWCVVRIVRYEPIFEAEIGPIEPFLRIGLAILISLILWSALRSSVAILHSEKKFNVLVLAGFVIYAVCALFTCALLPFFGEYKYLESTSYGSVIWSTSAVLYVFKDLYDRNRSLMELDALKKELINHVTHEFRTPLGVISSAVEIIDATKPHERKKLKDYLRMIDSNVNRLSHFVNELLDLAAIQQAKVRLNKTEADLFSLIEKTVARLKPLAEKECIKISLEGASLPYVCDEEKIEQVIVNLISNAIKATPGGQIDISVQQDSGDIHLSVTDNGIGIDREHLDHIFSSFYRIAIKQSPHKGTGLGLAIAKGWVEAHGGKIWAESKGEGNGTTFKIILPSRN